MPYITERQRDEIAKGAHPINPGELNYAITALVMRYVRDMQLSYGVINEVVGALECAKQEFYRRVAIPYENGKMASNGDVYTGVAARG